MIKVEVALFLGALCGILAGVCSFLIWSRLKRLGLDSWKSKKSMGFFMGLLMIFAISTYLENNREPVLKRISYRMERPMNDAGLSDEQPPKRQVRLSKEGSAGLGLMARPVYKKQLTFMAFTLLFLFLINAEVVKKRFGLLQTSPGSNKRAHARPKNLTIDTNQLISKLTIALSEQKLYSDASLSLDRLSEELNVSKYHLSQVINDGLGKNFYELINGYRVDEAIRMIEKTDENQTLLGIGFEVGFNSKASFYRAFKKSTGQTPAAYRKSVKQC